MAVHQLIQALEQLKGLHDQLLQIASEKTTALIDGNMENLQRILIAERRLITKIVQAEDRRSEAATEYAAFLGMEKNVEAKITELLEGTENRVEQTELEQATVKLVELITKLKTQEEINQQLLTQSLQFVQFSLNTINPSLDQLNYGLNKPDQARVINKSMYDSEA